MRIWALILNALAARNCECTEQLRNSRKFRIFYALYRNETYGQEIHGQETYEKEAYEMGYLISETTKEEREAIVAESLGNIEATCDGCMSGLAEMYQDYIDGKKELREINMEFNARYVHGEDMPGRSGCGYK